LRPPDEFPRSFDRIRARRSGAGRRVGERGPHRSDGSGPLGFPGAVPRRLDKAGSVPRPDEESQPTWAHGVADSGTAPEGADCLDLDRNLSRFEHSPGPSIVPAARLRRADQRSARPCFFSSV